MDKAGAVPNQKFFSTYIEMLNPKEIENPEAVTERHEKVIEKLEIERINKMKQLKEWETTKTNKRTSRIKNRKNKWNNSNFETILF